MITHNQLMRYVALQHIGIVNMNDLEAVNDLTGLSINDIRYIQENYKALQEEELPKNTWEITRDIIQAIPINDYPIKL